MLRTIAVRAATSWTVIAVIFLTTMSNICRRGEALLDSARTIAHVIGAKLPEEFIERRVRFVIDVHDEGVVVILVESMKKVPDKLILVKGIANCC
jgi:hypothetical protein